MHTISKWIWGLAGILIGIAGVYCFLHPEMAVLSLAAFIGWMLLFGGLLHLMRYFLLPSEARSGWFLFGAALDILFGGYVLSAGRVAGFAAVLVLFFAAYVLVRGIITVVRFAQGRFRGLPHRGLFLGIGIVTALFGVALLIWPRVSLLVIAWQMGIGLLLCSLSSFVLLMDMPRADE